MLHSFANYLAVIITSAVKYFFGVTGAIASNFNFIETLICTVGGGMLGVVVYLYLWDLMLGVYYKFFPKKLKPYKPVSKGRRKLFKFIIKYETLGIALLTPILLSVPIGTILASTFEENKWKIKWYMFLSFLGWSVAIYFCYDFIKAYWQQLLNLF